PSLHDWILLRQTMLDAVGRGPWQLQPSMLTGRKWLSSKGKLALLFGFRTLEQFGGTREAKEIKSSSVVRKSPCAFSRLGRSGSLSASAPINSGARCAARDDQLSLASRASSCRWSAQSASSGCS